MDAARGLALSEAWQALRSAIALHRVSMLTSTELVNGLEEKRQEYMEEAFEDEDTMVTQDGITYKIMQDHPEILTSIRQVKLDLIKSEGKLEQARLDWEYQMNVAKLESEVEE